MLVRHVAGFPTATEQRCVRCCEIIRTRESCTPSWPGIEVVMGSYEGPVMDSRNSIDCAPHDPHAIDEFKDALREALAEGAR